MPRSARRVSVESLQGALTSLLLPPLALVLLAGIAGVLAWRGKRWAGGLVLAASLAQLFLATPYVSGLLMESIEAEIADSAQAPPPGAIVILSAEAATGRDGLAPGALTLERMRAGVRVYRETGLPVLVTGGPPAHATLSLGEIMARSLREDFGVPVRWVEDRAADTRENALFSTAMLRADGIGAALLVTHAWHLPRAQEAFARAGLPTHPRPVRIDRRPPAGVAEWIPQPDMLARSWYALRERAGRLVYTLRDGPAPEAPR